jgi:uncharacterized protein (DUF433 family)
MSDTNGNKVVVQTSRGPSIKGTRLTIYSLMEYLKDGWTPKHTAQWFNLTPEEMDEVLAYLKENEAEVEADYAEVMAEAEAQRIYWTERNKDREDHSNAPPPANAKIAIARARLAAIKQQRQRQEQEQCESS